MTPTETVHTFIDRLCAMDLDGAGALLADDVEYDNVPYGKNEGKAATLEFLSVLTSFSKMEFITHRETATGNVVMNERTDRFTVGDKVADAPVTGVWEVNDDGLIVLWRDYFDMGHFNEVMALMA